MKGFLVNCVSFWKRQTKPNRTLTSDGPPMTWEKKLPTNTKENYLNREQLIDFEFAMAMLSYGHSLHGATLISVADSSPAAPL